METIGEKIRKLRKSKNVPQEELAFELGVSRQTVHKWENNDMQPSTDNLKLLCDYFKVSFTYFFLDTSNLTDETACTDDKKRLNTHFILYAIVIAIVSLALIVALGFTICFGLVAFSNNLGHDYLSVLEIGSYSFYLFLILSLILLALNITMVFLLKKAKVN